MDNFKKVLFFENYGIKLLFITDATENELQNISVKILEDIENNTTKDFCEYFDAINRIYEPLFDTEASGVFASDYIELIGYDLSFNID